MDQEENNTINFMYKPETGTALAVASAISFYFLCMALSMVGPAGVRQDHYARNESTFLLVLAITLLLSGLSIWSKMGRRKTDGSGLPYFSFGLCAICILAFIIQQMNGFAI